MLISKIAEKNKKTDLQKFRYSQSQESIKRANTDKINGQSGVTDMLIRNSFHSLLDSNFIY